jgi:hypothetical protein
MSGSSLGKRAGHSSIYPDSTHEIPKFTLSWPAKPSWKDDESRRTLCFAGIVRDYGENRQKSTHKASVVTTIVARCSKRSAFSIGFGRMPTDLHFEAFYASWISLWDKYYLQKGGQDLCRRPDSEVSNYVQGQLSSSRGHDIR